MIYCSEQVNLSRLGALQTVAAGVIMKTNGPLEPIKCAAITGGHLMRRPDGLPFWGAYHNRKFHNINVPSLSVHIAIESTLPTLIQKVHLSQLDVPSELKEHNQTDAAPRAVRQSQRICGHRAIQSCYRVMRQVRDRAFSPSERVLFHARVDAQSLNVVVVKSKVVKGSSRSQVVLKTVDKEHEKWKGEELKGERESVILTIGHMPQRRTPPYDVGGEDQQGSRSAKRASRDTDLGMETGIKVNAPSCTSEFMSLTTCVVILFITAQFGNDWSNWYWNWIRISVFLCSSACRAVFTGIDLGIDSAVIYGVVTAVLGGRSPDVWICLTAAVSSIMVSDSDSDVTMNLTYDDIPSPRWLSLGNPYLRPLRVCDKDILSLDYNVTAVRPVSKAECSKVHMKRQIARGRGTGRDKTVKYVFALAYLGRSVMILGPVLPR
ncbi:uncharacterized protein EDB93DRAFT_1268263 [Suillus bovinus]|uniref:uncharacterized protein n=1 Tax=Suillus bovinus TaxID=48563 RepID=UPI001B87008E|nr:uncharacterized protein EDB93DRAFT_1268263 [Suillus bovinus]KAG2128628.1 hypothetical protein EDB93DRAFT_1268263 [Suillus bovinus]